ncbi:MAG: hypothetical protein K2I69_03940 [Muribaculaceae bacterium]|nr:hypothetical protein [Muribaculaceae bacterium]
MSNFKIGERNLKSVAVGTCRSRIIAGKFGDTIGLSDYETGDSIWESRILSLMTEETRMEKFIASASISASTPCTGIVRKFWHASM